MTRLSNTPFTTGTAGIEGEVREHLGRLRFRQTVIHRPVQMKWNLRNLAGGKISHSS